jgi:membrane protease YdiL (CAAX protease family)
LSESPAFETPSATPLDQPVDRYGAVRQYSLAKIVGVWAAAALPMGFLAWVCVPLLSDQLGGRDPFIKSLLICFNVGLLWVLALTLILLRREQGRLEWSRVRDGLWLRSPRSPKTGKIGGTVWLWAIPFAVLSVAINALPIDPEGPLPRDLPVLLQKDQDRLENFFSGSWAWFALLVLLSFLAPVVEELFFRGLLLPRMRNVFGRIDWVVNGASLASTTCTSRGVCLPAFSTGRWLRPFPRSGIRAPGWDSSHILFRASSSSGLFCRWCCEQGSGLTPRSIRSLGRTPARMVIPP